MPKKIDSQVKERCVRQVLEHLSEYASLTAAAEVVGRRESLGKETVGRWVLLAQVDGRSWSRRHTSPRSPQTVRKKSKTGAEGLHITESIIPGQAPFSTSNRKQPVRRGKFELYYDI